jgi:polar amino acid transport system substrate-binding protein
MKTRRIVVALATAAALTSGSAAWAVSGGPGTGVTRGAVKEQLTATATCNTHASSLRPTSGTTIASGSYVAAIKARGYLIAGVDQSTYHFGFLNPIDGQIEGFDIDMINAVTKAIFGVVNNKVLHFKAITDAERIPDITNGTIDIVAHTMTITCARLLQIDFSSVYFDAHQRVLTLTGNPATSLEALKGQKVCATTGSDSLTKIQNAGAIPVPVAYWTDCLVLLQQDQVAGISTDDSILLGLKAQDPWTQLIGPSLSDEPYGLAISKQHPDFVRFVNAVLEQLRSNGSWAASYARWIGGSQTPPAAEYAP